MSVGVARRFVADVLLSRDFPKECIERAALLASELVTSTVVGANRHIELVVIVDHPMLRVEVHGRNVPLELDVSAASPYRLRVLEGLSEAWGVEPGRFAWFEARA